MNAPTIHPTRRFWIGKSALRPPPVAVGVCATDVGATPNADLSAAETEARIPPAARPLAPTGSPVGDRTWSRFRRLALTIFASGSLFALALPARADPQSDCMKASGEPAEDVCARAVLAASEAIAREPKAVIPLVDRADAQLAKGNVSAALADYDMALRISPSNPDLYLFRGRAQERALAFDRAIPDLDRALGDLPSRAFSDQSASYPAAAK
jgi:cytochrome c-type biogenesis protein CcmH/NrfG